SGENEAKVVSSTTHSEQVQKNDYHIERHTLRLLVTLGDMARRLPEAGQRLDLPVLILHGGKDIFTDPQKVVTFSRSLPAETQAKYLHYPEAHHLLFHDTGREKVIADILDWLATL
ncbi:MAG: alpha/beta hydrolase, partial [Verrucomicrobiales bacterium]